MLSFKNFIQLTEGAGEKALAKLIDFGVTKAVKAYSSYRNKKKEKKQHDDRLSQDKPSDISKDNTISHETDEIEKTRKSEDEKNKKRFDKYQKDLHNYSYGSHTWGPDQYDPSGIGPAKQPRMPRNPLNKRRKKPKQPWRSSQQDHDVLDQIFGPEKK